jgi:hypothetical protein
MANSCENRIKIIGKPANLYKFCERLREQENFLHYENYNKIFDIPESDEYEWSSKWHHFDDFEYSIGDDTITLFGSSAWQPAEGFWEKVSLDFQFEVELEYSEGGENIAGYITWNSGEITKCNEMTWWQYIYFVDREHFWETITSQIDDLDQIKDYLNKVDLSKDDKIKIEEIYNEKFIN